MLYSFLRKHSQIPRSSHEFESDTIDPHAPFTNDLDRTMALSWQLDSFTISPRVSFDSRSTMIERFWIGFDHNMRLWSQMPENVSDEIAESDGEDALQVTEVD